MTETLRRELQIIAEWVTPGSRVLDVGCGDGELLAWLARNKQVDGRGLEMSPESVGNCVGKGQVVIQGDANIDLAYYATGSFDFVIMSQTLQRMDHPDKTLKELIRIGKQVIVSVPNFAHWRNRFYLLVNGRMPVTSSLSYEWFETPNIHFCSLADFAILCQAMGVTVEKQLYLTAHEKAGLLKSQSWLANLFGEQGIFLLKSN